MTETPGGAHIPPVHRTDTAGPGWMPQVRVRGDATIEAAPELATFSVTIEERAKGHWETFENVSRRSNECLTLISAYGPAIEETETSRLWVSPEPHHHREKVRWYRGAILTRFTVSDFSVIGELLSRIYDLGPAAVQGPRWQLRPSSPVYREARAGAVRAALTRAAEYADAFGARLTALLELSDEAFGPGGTVCPAAVGTVAAAATVPGASAVPGLIAGPPGLDLEPVPQAVRACVRARFLMAHPPSLHIPDS